MRSNFTLPPASDEALSHSQSLLAHIHKEIQSNGGWITFDHFMRMALYEPGLGYYSSGATKLGRDGDFVTAPEISPLFGRTLAQQALQIIQHTDQPGILEFGAGSGKLALDLLQELEKLNHLPQQYYIIEISAELKQRQYQLFEQEAPHLLHRLTWLERLPDQFSGLILANEVLDAMPVHIVNWQKQAIVERCVALSRDNQLILEEHSIEDNELLHIAEKTLPFINPDNDPGLHYVSEINLLSRHFIRSLAKMLQKGVILLIDYGFGHAELYHPQRNQGTLMCHYRHHAHDDPFFLPGLQDITSHVDFSALLQEAEENGLTFSGYTTQAHFLINSGITGILARTPAENVTQYLPQASQLQKLISPAEMGELFKVLALTKNFNEALTGFNNGDLSRLL